jgi:enoyl-CoA hydratase/carnithine racemase
MPHEGVAAMLHCLVGFEDNTLEQLIAYERTALNSTRGSANSREGMQAFLEKRKPIFGLD